MATEAKLFVGQAEKVEKAFNRWSTDGDNRAIVMILPLQQKEPGEVGFMVLFQPLPATNGASKIMPVSGMVH